MSDNQPEDIKDESSYQKTLTILSAQSKPSKILCKLMNMLESYRQSRKMGWSRPWNKYGLTTFTTFKLKATEESDLIEKTSSALSSVPSVNEDALKFCNEILVDRDALMGFIFYSDFIEEPRTYQSITLSFGRKVPGQPRFRDRFDIIYDLEVIDGIANAPSRIRLYIDPYADCNKSPLLQTSFNSDDYPAFNVLFSDLCSKYQQWANIPERHWDHWTSRYIDYFGERNTNITNAYF